MRASLTGPRRYAATLTAALVLATAALTGCSSDGADVKCSLNDCTVSLDRGVDAKTSVLGLEVKLVSVQNGNVRLDVGGNTVDIPAGGDAEAQAGGLRFRVDSLTDSKVTLKVSRN